MPSRSPSPARSALRSRSRSISRDRSRTRSPSPTRPAHARSAPRSASRSPVRDSRSPSPRRNGRRSYTPGSRSRSRGRSYTRSPSPKDGSPAPRSAKVGHEIEESMDEANPPADCRGGTDQKRQRRPHPRDLWQIRRHQGPAHAHESDLQRQPRHGIHHVRRDRRRRARNRKDARRTVGRSQATSLDRPAQAPVLAHASPSAQGPTAARTLQ
jgi:hypothetical protein